MSRRLISKTLIYVGCLFILTAAILCGYNLWDENRAGQAVDKVMTQMSLLIESSQTVKTQMSTSVESQQTAIVENRQQPSDIQREDNIVNNEPVIPDYVIDPNRDMPSEMIDGNEYIGMVYISSLDISLPVISDWNYDKMKISPCRYYGSAYTDDLIIAAHNYKTHFGTLKNIQLDDIVVFTDMDENTFTYYVSDIQILNGTDIEKMKNGEWDLTLFTCTIGGKSRITVRCTLMPNYQVETRGVG